MKGDRHLSQIYAQKETIHKQELEKNEQMDTPLTHTQLLTNKHAVIFGAGGSVGTAVAKEFAAQGATVFLSGRTLNSVEQVAQDIHQDGGIAYAAQVDALDEQAVNAYLDRVAQEGGSIDILSCTLIVSNRGEDFSERSEIYTF